jgi:S-adenosylmethionine-diacylglycerol 3-amino-3-carboxypropyl transferase
VNNRNAVKTMSKIQNLIFNKIHGSQLIYNTCWEDPRIDRQILKLDQKSDVMMITSAGCNAIEYLLDDVRQIHCVDLNSRQNCLLELKRAVFLNSSYEDLFQWFGKGFHPRVKDLYGSVRMALPEYAQQYWDKRVHYFMKKPVIQSFYYRGASGLAAWLLKHAMFQVKPKIRYEVYDLIEAKNVQEQKEIFERIEKQLWGKMVEWMLKNPMMMSMVGVPAAQVSLINRDVEGGLVAFVRSCLRKIFTELSLADNYFWRVYICGEYTKACCPEYLKEEYYETIKNRLHRLSINTNSFAQHLSQQDINFSHYILLDHQDWLAWFRPDLLDEEWRQIKAHSQLGSKVMMRSAGLKLDFCASQVKDWLEWNPQLTQKLHQLDRVGTYGSLHLGQVCCV